jgi:hypothetical protein
MARWVRVSQISWRLPKARNVLFRLSPTELLSGQAADKFDTSIVPEKTIEQKNDSQGYGFRPLTDAEKKEFENSLDDDGKKILRELSEKPDTKVTKEVSERKTKTHSIWSAAVIPTIVDP